LQACFSKFHHLQAINVFNHSNLTGDSTTATTHAAEVITAPPSFAHASGLDARILEFGPKIDS
jgi:hypothetical protein